MGKSNLTECDCITCESELILVCKHLSVTPMGLDEAYAMCGYSIQLQQRQQTSSILTLTILQEYVVYSRSSKMD